MLAKMIVRILFIGDVVGAPGRSAVTRILPALREQHAPDLIVINGENAAGGFGITADTALDLFRAGADILTSGNHIWDKQDTGTLLDREDRIIRPINYPPGTAGRGYSIITIKPGVSIAVVNLEGRVYMKNLDCPFRTMDQVLEVIHKETPIVFVDFHAEATSEKSALGWYLDGKVSAVIGTHTHVQTADERILPKGTAYLTDVGMTGSFDSVIGIEAHQAIQRFLTQQSVRFDVPKKNLRINATIIEIDSDSGKAVAIKRINQSAE